MFSLSSFSALAVEECTEEANLVLQDWMTKNPGDVGLFSLYRGHGVGNQESRYVSQKSRNDKFKHCFVGCRIAFEVNLATALYAGWYKEQRDLTDCDPSTNFDPRDEEATRRGALAGDQIRESGSLSPSKDPAAIEENRQACLQVCLPARSN